MNALNLNEIDWGDIILELTAYAHFLINRNTKFWSRGPNALPKGYEAKDFALETIMKFIENPDKFDPSRNENLLSFLKYNILRRLVSNLLSSSNNIKLNEGRKQNDEFLSSEVLANPEVNYPTDYFELLMVEEIDRNTIIADIEKSIAEDDELMIVFVAIVHEHSKRQEICMDLGIEPREYDNILKRLKRRIDKILLKYS